MSATIVSGEKVSYFEYQFDIFTFDHKLHINYHKNEVYMLNPNRVGVALFSHGYFSIKKGV